MAEPRNPRHIEALLEKAGDDPRLRCPDCGQPPDDVELAPFMPSRGWPVCRKCERMTWTGPEEPIIDFSPVGFATEEPANSDSEPPDS